MGALILMFVTEQCEHVRANLNNSIHQVLTQCFSWFSLTLLMSVNNVGFGLTTYPFSFVIKNEEVKEALPSFPFA